MSAYIDRHTFKAINTRFPANQMIPSLAVLANIEIKTISPLHPTTLEVSALHRTRPECVVFRPISKLKLLCLFVVLLATHSMAQEFAHGTTIAIVRTKDTIIVAADSRTSLETTNRGQGRATEDKIFIVGDVAFTTAGYVRESRIKYNLVVITRTILENFPGNIYAKAAIVHDSVLAWAKLAWDALPKYRRIDASAYPVGVTLLGFWGRVPTVLTMGFARKEAGGGRTRDTVYLGEFPRPSAMDSTYTAVFESLNPDPRSRVLLERDARKNPIEAARGFVERAIQRDSVHNGGPVKVLCIHAGGMNWVDYPEEGQTPSQEYDTRIHALRYKCNPCRAILNPVHVKPRVLFCNSEDRSMSKWCAQSLPPSQASLSTSDESA